MRILFIGADKTDYIQNLTYLGLSKLLGVKNIIEHSWNYRLHTNHNKYPKNVGSSLGSTFRSLLRNRNRYDVVMIASNRTECIQRYLEIEKDIPPGKKVIFLDGGDRPELAGDIVRIGKNEELRTEFLNARPFDIIFKREYLKSERYDNHIHPLPISFDFTKLPRKMKPRPKKYDVALWATESHPDRSAVFDILKDQFDCNENGTISGLRMNTYKRRGEHYLKEVAATKVSLNIRGGGWDTFRYWETPAVGGFMISQPLDIVIPNDFESDKHIVHCAPDFSDLLDLCNYYLKNDAKREKIAEKGKQHIFEHHSYLSRAEYILDKIKAL